jgi:hypothetical protein
MVKLTTITNVVLNTTGHRADDEQKNCTVAKIIFPRYAHDLTGAWTFESDRTLTLSFGSGVGELLGKPWLNYQN